MANISQLTKPLLSLIAVLVFLIPSVSFAQSADTSIPVYTRSLGGGTDEYFIAIPKGNTSTCTWTYAGGSAAVPYSVTTNSQSYQPDGGNNAPQSISFPDSSISSYFDFQVTCVNDYGDRYVGVFPSGTATPTSDATTVTAPPAGSSVTPTSDTNTGSDAPFDYNTDVAPAATTAPATTSSDYDWNWLWLLGILGIAGIGSSAIKLKEEKEPINGWLAVLPVIFGIALLIWAAITKGTNLLVDTYIFSLIGSWIIMESFKNTLGYELVRIAYWIITIAGSLLAVVLLFMWLGSLSIAPDTIIIILLVLILFKQT